MKKLIVGIMLLGAMNGAQAVQSYGHSVTYSNLAQGAVGDTLSSLNWEQFCQAHGDITNARTFANIAYTRAPYGSQTRAWALHAQNAAIRAQSETYYLCYRSTSFGLSSVLRELGDMTAYTAESMLQAFKKK